MSTWRETDWPPIGGQTVVQSKSEHELGSAPSWEGQGEAAGVPHNSARGGSGGEGGPDVAGMNDDQLYSLIMAMNPPPQASIPAGATERQAPMSVEEAKRAIQSAKTAIGAKGTPRSEQTDGGSGSDDEDFSPKGRSGKNKRVMANRQSAQRSRLRKLQYIQDLENNVNRLQSEIGQIQPQLTFLRDKYSGLSSQNQKLRDRVAALLNEARYKESVNTSLKEEISRMIPMTGAAGDASHFTAGEAHDTFVAPPASLHYTAPMQQ